MDEVKIGEILLPGEESEQEKQARKVQSKFWPVFRKAIRQIPLGRDVVAAYYCAMDPATPTRVRGVLLAALAYFILPIDVVPDMLALIGFGDDMAVLMTAIAMVRGSMNESHYDKADSALSDDTARS